MYCISSLQLSFYWIRQPIVTCGLDGGQMKRRVKQVCHEGGDGVKRGEKQWRALSNTQEVFLMKTCTP